MEETEEDEEETEDEGVPGVEDERMRTRSGEFDPVPLPSRSAHLAVSVVARPSLGR